MNKLSLVLLARCVMIVGNPASSERIESMYLKADERDKLLALIVAIRENENATVPIQVMANKAVNIMRDAAKARW